MAAALNSVFVVRYCLDSNTDFGSKPEWIFRAGSNLGGRTGFFYF